MGITAVQIQAMSKKEMGILLHGIIQLCGGFDKFVDKSGQVLIDINQQVSKMDNIDAIKISTDNVGRKITTLTEKINELETSKKQMADLELPRKFQELDQRLGMSISEISKAQAYQQKFMEEMDARSRRNKLVILGVPEESEGSPLGQTDRERVLHVIQKTEVDVSLHMDSLSIRRLGMKRSHPRPLLITFDSHEICKEIVLNAKNLKYASDCNSIFIRKDIHPTLRYEANRLRIRERNERANPENRNADIQYDRKERVLVKNGIVIDRFRPSFL